MDPECLAVRTQHLPNPGKCLPREMVAKVNDVNRRVAHDMGVPLFEWEGEFSKMVSHGNENPWILSLCHQTSDASYAMTKSFETFMEAKMPSKCAKSV